MAHQPQPFTPSLSPQSTPAERLQRALRAPAIALAVLAFLAILLDAASVGLFLFNLVQQEPQPGVAAVISPASQLILLITMFMVHNAVLYGSFCMLEMKNYGAARVACVLAMIPLCSPLYFIGIMAAVPAFVQLNKKHAPSHFDAHN